MGKYDDFFKEEYKAEYVEAYNGGDMEPTWYANERRNENNKESLDNYRVWHPRQNKWKVFYHCADERDAKERFQFVYGFWPDLAEIDRSENR